MGRLISGYGRRVLLSPVLLLRGLQQSAEVGPWIIMGNYVTVLKWRQNFCPEGETITSTLVWLRFPRLHLELFDEDGQCSRSSNQSWRNNHGS